MVLINSISYRIRYISIFTKCCKLLRISLSFVDILELIYSWSNDKAYYDENGKYYYNNLIKSYIYKYNNSIDISRRDLILISINYKILSNYTGLLIIKYLPYMNYISKREMNNILYKIREVQ